MARVDNCDDDGNRSRCLFAATCVVCRHHFCVLRTADRVGYSQPPSMARVIHWSENSLGEGADAAGPDVPGKRVLLAFDHASARTVLVAPLLGHGRLRASTASSTRLDRVHPSPDYGRVRPPSGLRTGVGFPVLSS